MRLLVPSLTNCCVLGGTYAFGEIGKDTVSLAGLNITNQYFAAISPCNTRLPSARANTYFCTDETDTTIVATGSAGILGLGFPVNRCG